MMNTSKENQYEIKQKYLSENEVHRCGSHPVHQMLIGLEGSNGCHFKNL
uniref:Uncharacterized protein n=1 Tax=Rhizophora mucronata TaxID=61149 RepID=A0A2P2NYD3_RHIMU